MVEEQKQIKSYDGFLLYAKEFIADNPKGEIIITTDVKEYSGLYDEFALKMQTLGYNVFTYDIRAHKESSQGPFGTYQGNFFNDAVRDVLYLNKYLAKKYSLPIINIGVGFGGVIVTRAMQFYHEKCKNIIVGSPFELFNIKNYCLVCLTRLTMVFLNKQSEAKSLNKLIFNKYAKKFEEGAYISTNKIYMDKIKRDKFCNFNLSANILNSIYKGLATTYSKKNLVKIDTQQEFLLTSGEYDIVTDFSKKTTQLASRFKSCKIKYDKIIFKDLRHNLLNESSDTFIEYLQKFIEEDEENKGENI